jgi:hypothetical protein
MDAAKWASVSDDTCQLITISAESPLLPDGTNQYLLAVGLPSVLIFEGESPFEIRFAALTRPLVPYSSLVKWGDFYDAALDEQWASRIVIADEEFCNGTACYCVESATGRVVRVDCELSDPERFVNTSIDHFARCAFAAIHWTKNGAGDLSLLESEFQSIDPAAMSDNNSYWPGLFSAAKDYYQAMWLVSCDPTKSEPRF